MTASAACAVNEVLGRPVVTDSYEHDAFGNSFTVSGSTPNEMLYRGEQYDSDLGLYYLRARYYNPLTGRFMSRDPEDANPIDPKTLHRYLYASGDPVNLFDPSGRDSILETGSLDKIIGTAAFPALIEVAGTAATNAIAATGVQDAIAGFQLAAEAGSWGEVVDILTYTVKTILQTKPLVRLLLCSPLGLGYELAEDQLNDYAAKHHWTWIGIKAMDKGLDYGKDALLAACTGYVAFGGK